MKYTASAVPFRILRNGLPITETNRKVLPGEGVSLSVEGADSNTTYLWANPPGDVFKEYLITGGNGVVQRLNGPIDYSLATFFFRWVEGQNADRDVDCTVLVGGVPTLVTDKLYVGKLTGTFKATGTPSVSVDASVVELRGLTNDPIQGISWKGSSVDVPPFHSGSYGFFQTGTVSRGGYVSTGSGPDYKGQDFWRLPLLYSVGLDGQAPYAGSNGIFPAGTTVPQFGDSPNQGFSATLTYPNLSPGQALQKLVISDSYDTWLMFKSDESNSAWVPVKKIHWDWGVTAKPNLNISQQLPPAYQEGQDTTSFPTWSSVINPAQVWQHIGSNEP